MDEFIDLVIVTLYTLVATALTLVFRPSGVLALVIVAPIVLLLPGYALLSAALPISSLGKLERFTISLSLSLALTILGGLVLNLVPGGLTTLSWTLLLSFLIVLGCVVAFVRRQLSKGASHNADVGRGAVREYIRRIQQIMPALASAARWRVLGTALALFIVIGAIIFSTMSAVQQPYPGFTQLWMLPAQVGDKQSTVQIGIVNDEVGHMSYTLVVKQNDQTIRRITGISLYRHRQWEETIHFVIGNKQVLVEGDLYRTDQLSVVYRSVKVWLGSSSNGT